MCITYKNGRLLPMYIYLTNFSRTTLPNIFAQVVFSNKNDFHRIFRLDAWVCSTNVDDAMGYK